jgi:hypothetical protein
MLSNWAGRSDVVGDKSKLKLSVSMKGSVPPKTSIGTLILDQIERCSYWLNISILYTLSGLAEHSRGSSCASRTLFVIAVKKVPQEIQHEVRVTGPALAMKGLVPKKHLWG